MENAIVIRNEVKTWMTDLLKHRFATESNMLNTLSMIDMFYLYIEVYAKYNLNLCADKNIIYKISTVDDMVDYICDKFIF